MTPEEVKAMLVEELVTALKARTTDKFISTNEVVEKWRQGANAANVTSPRVQAHLIAAAYDVLEGKS